ncbi:unnamed protein product [Protopolystoma xenopodis]|uniref:Uncharacterized protein n=1 Tax=Protopolystoma xenopodis TaxID=117903 RepID=A0A448X9J7_9PLAT|nr:unnamed protein product [Protopolystoma xenopodis]
MSFRRIRRVTLPTPLLLMRAILLRVETSTLKGHRRTSMLIYLMCQTYRSTRVS